MRWSLTTSSGPSLEPLTAAEAKLYAKIDLSDDDTIVERQITAGRQLAETVTRRAFVNQTLDFWGDRWADEIILPRPPVSTVSYVKYRDDAGTWTTLSSSYYELDYYREPARVVLAYGYDWPTIINRPNAINIRYIAGYGSTAASVPAAIREAIAAYVLSLYDERGVIVVGTISNKLPFSAVSLLDPYVVRDYALTQGDE